MLVPMVREPPQKPQCHPKGWAGKQVTGRANRDGRSGSGQALTKRTWTLLGCNAENTCWETALGVQALLQNFQMISQDTWHQQSK